MSVATARMPARQNTARRVAISPAGVFSDDRLGAAEQAMLACLGMYADTETGWCWPRQRTLAALLGITRQAVGARLRTLAECGWIEIADQFDPRTHARTSSRYRIVWDHEVPPEHRRTLKPEIAALATVTGGARQREVADPAIPAGGVRQPGVAANKEERPRLTTQVNGPTGESGAAAPAPATGGTTPQKSDRPPIPETLEPDAADLAVGAGLGYSPAEVAAMVPAMLDNWRVRGKWTDDWHGALRSWIRKEPAYGLRPPPPRSAAPPPRAAPAGRPLGPQMPVVNRVY